MGSLVDHFEVSVDGDMGIVMAAHGDTGSVFAFYLDSALFVWSDLCAGIGLSRPVNVAFYAKDLECLGNVSSRVPVESVVLLHHLYL